MIYYLNFLGFSLGIICCFLWLSCIALKLSSSLSWMISYNNNYFIPIVSKIKLELFTESYCLQFKQSLLFKLTNITCHVIKHREVAFDTWQTSRYIVDFTPDDFQPIFQIIQETCQFTVNFVLCVVSSLIQNGTSVVWMLSLTSDIVRLKSKSNSIWNSASTRSSDELQYSHCF